MNLLEKYVYNYKVLEISEDGMIYKLKGDTECWGVEKFGEVLEISKKSYESIQENGYYLV